jgi:glycopeptide antibiotics resistance protein
LIYLAGFILVKKLNYTKKIFKINLVLYFIIYTITIVALTLFDEIFGRNGLVFVNWNKQLLDSYMKYSFNIVPFKTIRLFINGYLNDLVSFKNFSINIFGNLFALMPYGMFIPLMFKKVNKYYKFLILMVILVIGIELLQFITLSGSCDIDDLILNVLGASIVYFICQIKVIRKMINKIFLFE